jgi:hypothetical protein
MRGLPLSGAFRTETGLLKTELNTIRVRANVIKAEANILKAEGNSVAKQEASTSNAQFNGQNSTQSATQREAFRKAKDQNGIPRSQQPDKTSTVRDKHTGQPLKVYEFTNSAGKKVTIRKDNPITYPDGGRQGPHFNAGPSGGKLKQHHNISNASATLY